MTPHTFRQWLDSLSPQDYARLQRMQLDYPGLEPLLDRCFEAGRQAGIAHELEKRGEMV